MLELIMLTTREKKMSCKHKSNQSQAEKQQYLNVIVNKKAVWGNC